MKFGPDGIEEYDLKMTETEKPNLRVTYGVPWCEVCGDYVEKFELVHGVPNADSDTLVAYCHGSQHEKVIRRQMGVGEKQTKSFFDGSKFHTLNGKDNRRRIMRTDHEMYEIDKRMKSLGWGHVGIGGEIKWKPKK